MDSQGQSQSQSYKAYSTHKDWSAVSSQIAVTAYNPEKRELVVQFKKTGNYKYLGISEEMWLRLLATDSIGRFIAVNIKPNCKYLKI